jgi:hypothetical protein
MPSTLQLSVTGSFRGTVVSIGCSIIRGIWKAVEKNLKRFVDWFMF